MAIGKIKGPMLYDDLARRGVDLSFDGNLLYLDVTARRLGVGTASPQYGLDVPANVRIGNLTILGNTIALGSIPPAADPPSRVPGKTPARPE